MLSSVLGSDTAIDVNIAIMRTFVKLREMMLAHSELEKKINSLERHYDSQFKVVFNSIRELIRTNTTDENVRKKNKIGFCR